MARTLHAREERFALNRPFRIARGTKTEALVVVAEIADGGFVGCGEAVPYARYGESTETALADIARVHDAIERGADRAALMELLPPGAARNALDCALWDLEAKLSGTSVRKMLGEPLPSAIVSALTIVIDRPEAMADAAHLIADTPLLKVKVDAEAPAAQLRAVRSAAPDAALIVDPNESWNEALLREMVPLLQECAVSVIEQPVPADDDDWLVDYKCPIPICADEAVHVSADLDRVSARYDAINVKLDKTGGLTAALELAAEARRRGMGLMCGCMVSSSLGIVPALHIARMADWVDLDGPVWLLEDRPGGVRDERGYLLPPQEGFWG